MDIILIAAVGAYLIGSIPFGLLLTKAAGLGDIRKIGSGNIGATNVLRTGKKWLALLTLVLDFIKGGILILLLQIYLIPVNLSMHDLLGNDDIVDTYMLYLYLLTTISVATVVGHMFPVWLKFRGGKGVACIFGLTYALNWQAGLAVSVSWLLIFFTTRYSSLGALIGIPVGLMVATQFGDYIFIWQAVLVPTLLMIVKHHENIRRLLKGEEHRFSFSSKDKN